MPLAISVTPLSLREILPFLSPLNIVTIIAFLGLFAASPQKFVRGYKETPPILPISIFLAWILLSLTWAPGKYHGSPTFLKTLLVFLAFYLSIYAIETEKTLHLVIWSWIIANLMNSMIAFFNVIVLGSNTAQAGLTFLNHNFALLLILGIFLAYGKYKSTSSLRERYLIIITIIIMGIAFLYTGSRSGWLGFLCGIIFLTISSFGNISNKKDLIKMALKLITGCIGIIFFLFLLGLFAENIPIGKPPKRVGPGYQIIPRILSLTYVGEEESFAWRRTIWRLGFKMLAKTNRYFIGFGSGGWTEYLEGIKTGKIFDVLLKDPTVFKTSIAFCHNFYLTVLFEFGIIGLILFAWIIVRCVIFLVSSLKLIPEGQLRIMALSFIAGLIGFVVFGTTNFEYKEEIPWVYLAIGIAMLKIYSKEPRLQQKAFSL